MIQSIHSIHSIQSIHSIHLIQNDTFDTKPYTRYKGATSDIDNQIRHLRTTQVKLYRKTPPLIPPQEKKHREERKRKTKKGATTDGCNDI